MPSKSKNRARSQMTQNIILPRQGLLVTQEMQDILNIPGYLSVSKGGQKLRELYQDASIGFNPMDLSEFGQFCYFGVLDGVLEAMQSGSPPDLSSTESEYKFGYATLVIAGSQRTKHIPPAVMRHADVLKLLFSRGMPPDVEDIVGYTALHHITMDHNSDVTLARILLENGADPNHRNRYGAVPIFACFQINQIKCIELLMEFGADLSIADADNIVPSEFFVLCGPEVTATVQRFLRLRTGQKAPMEGKKCENCLKEAGKTRLKLCAKCRIVLYCSTECQRAHWSTHKKACVSFSNSDTVTIRPCYAPNGTAFPKAALARTLQGMPTNILVNEKHLRGAHTPDRGSSASKSLIIKIQVPYKEFASSLISPDPPSGDGPLFIYTKKRDFVCSAFRGDNPASYDRICQVVRSKGVRGAKAYFSAELKGKNELVVRISEVLAEQPF